VSLHDPVGGADPVMGFATAVSQHPDAAVAVAEVIGQSLEGTGEGPGLAIVFISGPHVAETGRIARAIREASAPRVLLGCTAGGTLAHRREIEEGPSIVLWTAGLDTARPLRLEGPRLPDDVDPESAVLIVADPFTFDAEALATSVDPTLTVVGGLASASSRPGGNHLVLDGDGFADGAVAVVLPPEAGVRAVVATGCRPVGDPMAVTGSEGPLITSLAGRPAMSRLSDLLSSADEATARRIRRDLHLGIVIDEHREAFGAGDFLIRSIMGVDRSSGSLAVGTSVPVGSTVQFQVRDAEAATADLEDRLVGLSADAALAFTCNGRGSHLFGTPGHDAEHLVDGLGTTAVAGMSCAGELGPVGDRHHLHGCTASVLTLGTSPRG